MECHLGTFSCAMPDGSVLRLVGGARAGNGDAARAMMLAQLAEHGVDRSICETLLPAGIWRQRYPQDGHAARIEAACVSEGQVSFLEHILHLPARAQTGIGAPDAPPLSTARFDVDPLISGDGRTLPETLAPYFDATGGAACLALLDAAQVPHLPEVIEASGLEHRCLFRGKAAEDLRDVAPWLVRLEPDSDFTRNLFTRGDAPWMLWGRATMLLLRTEREIDQVTDHFRRLTRIRSETDGRWLYFRFYDPETLEDLRPHLAESDARALLGPYRIAGVSAAGSTLYALREPPAEGSNQPRATFVLRDIYLDAMARRQERHFAEDLARDVKEIVPAIPKDEARRLVRVAIDFCAGVGLAQKDSIAGYALLSAQYGVDFVLRMASFACIADPTRSERERKTIIHSALKVT